MGGLCSSLCSKVSAVDKSPSGTTLGQNQVADHEPGTLGVEKPPASIEDVAAKRLEEQKQSFSLQESIIPGLSFQGGSSTSGGAGSRASPQLAWSLSQKACLAKARGRTAKISEVSSILSRASTVGFEKAVEVLDTFGSRMTSLNASRGFVSSSAATGNKMCMLAFEVANTIVRGCNLMCSVSRPSVKHLKEVVFHSEGVQHLISKDMDELLKIAAADKREELEILSKEVVRFGNRCNDPQWHNLDRYFEKLALEQISSCHLKENIQSVMQQLIISVQHTSKLYHGLHALDQLRKGYRRKQKEQDGSTSKGDSLCTLEQELESQRNLVKKLESTSLWSKNLEEMMENLIDIVHFIHQEMYNAFGCADTEEPQEAAKYHNRLGPAGLALHYANIINLIDTFVSEPTEVKKATMRDKLYRDLPPTIKSTLHSKLRSSKLDKELTATQIEAEMMKTLQWLVPFAHNTKNTHHGFGWVGEWANPRPKMSGQVDFTRIETLYHADKEATEAQILKLVVSLHHLNSKSRNANGDVRSPIKSPVSSLIQKRTTITLLPGAMNNSSLILQEDQDMLRDVKSKKFIPGISKSQEFDTKSRHCKQSRLSKSNSHSPASSNGKDFLSVRRLSMLPVIDFEIDRTKALDLIDRLDDPKIQ